MGELIDDLRQDIAKGDALVVVGSGVSRGATNDDDVASWIGLIESGINWCVTRLGMASDRANRIRDEVKSDHQADLLSAAEKISIELGYPNGPEYRRWLRETVGSLKAKDRDALVALKNLNVTLATTNYDGLLEEATGLPPVTWKDGDKVIRTIRREERGIVHLHGYWDAPQTVVLGLRSYTNILHDSHAQAVLQALCTLKTVVFAGCGDGLSDPNFSALFNWMREALKGIGTHIYRLCRTDEAPALRELHRHDSIYILPYGPVHSCLAQFIREMGSNRATGIDINLGASQSVLKAGRLPGHRPCFGREEETQDLVETLLLPSPPPTPVLGGPGAGKTTIILRALYDERVEARFGTRRFFVRCDGAGGREALVAAIARAIGLELSPEVEASLFRELATQPAVLVLDNAETPCHGPEQELVGELLCELGSIAGLSLVASVRGSESPWGPDWREAIYAGPLSQQAAREAFLRKAGKKKFANDPELDPLLEEVERLALAVVLLGYNAQPLADLSELRRQWREKRTGLLRIGNLQGPLDNLETSIELSIGSPRMTPEALRLLSILSLFPDGAGLVDLETIMPMSGESAAITLRRVGLADNQANRVRVLAPIREYVRKQYPPAKQDLDCAINHYLSIANSGRQVGREGGAEASARVVQDLGNVEAMIAIALDRSNPGLAIQSAIDLGQFVRFTGWGSRAPIESALVVARSLEAKRLHAACAERLGDIALYIHADHDEARARYEEALPLYRSEDDKLGEATCTWRLGDIALRRSKHDEARLFYEEALLIYKQVPDSEGEANCIQRLGDIDLEHFQLDHARARYQHALNLYRSVSDTRGEARCIQGLGDVSLLLSEYEEATSHYNNAQVLYNRVGDVLGATNCLFSLGDVALARSQHDLAREHFENALPLYQRLGGVLGQANCAYNLGNIALELFDYQAARTLYSKASALFQKCGSILGDAHCIKGFGDIALAEQDCESAHVRYQEAFSLYQRVESVLGQANCIQGFGDVAARLSDNEKAESKFKEALYLYERIPDPFSIGHAHARLARLAPQKSETRQDHIDKAEHSWVSINRLDLAENLQRELGGD